MMKKTLALILSLLLAAAMLAGCAGKTDAPAEVTVTVIYEDESAEEFTLSTEHDTLGDALVDAGLASQEEVDSGFVTTINGAFADFDADEAWWRVVDADGMDSLKGIGDIKTADADGYSFIYTIGF